MKDGSESFNLTAFLVVVAALFSALIFPLAIGLVLIPRKEKKG